MIRVGMSGFSYPEWIGEVYPLGTKRAAMLTEYAKIFPTVEINMTFRRTPEEKTIARWRESVPETFRFTMKAPQGITHWKRLVDVGEDVSQFVERCRGIGERLGPVLFQTPPKLEFDPAVIDAFGGSLPPGNTYAFEPRHGSFNDPAVDDAFRRHGIARCLNDEVFNTLGYDVTGPVAYFRFHRFDYGPGDLESRAALVRDIANSGVDVYVFFAHEDNPESVRPALRFRDLLN